MRKPDRATNGFTKNKYILKAVFLVLVGIISLALIAAAAYSVTAYVNLGDLEYKSDESTPANNTIEITQEPEASIPKDLPMFVAPTPVPTQKDTVSAPIPELEKDIINILILGCDTRQPGVFTDSRSDVNIIMTIDKKNGEVRMTSILRDVLIYYDDIDDYQRVNYALRHYDDPNKVIGIIENTFGVSIDYYMVADFFGVAELIDIFGGVTVNAQADEISNLNDILWNLNELYGYDLRKDFVLGEPGDILLTGRQAVAYMRVRKVGADYERVLRQYEVLQGIKQELTKMSFLEMNKILSKLPELIKTNMDQRELLSAANTLYKMKDSEMQNARVPFDGTYNSAVYKGMWVLDINLEKNKTLLYEFIYQGKLPD